MYRAFRAIILVSVRVRIERGCILTSGPGILAFTPTDLKLLPYLQTREPRSQKGLGDNFFKIALTPEFSDIFKKVYTLG